ncbi:phytanoyl-CoA dioxygenase [Alphaproteobacteria bacterium]|nr:phytanoyl-CoA dioxygenase [Alphaproteobacteria bacterium]
MQLIKNITETISRVGRNTTYQKGANLDIDKAVIQLKNRGFVMLDHMVGNSQLAKIKASINNKIEKDFELQFPCLSQSKIDFQRDKDLIEKNFLASNIQLSKRGLTFDRKDIKSYPQMLNDFRPPTLTLPMPSELDYYQFWLDPIVISIVSAYIGFNPHMTEAYVRRNFPSDFKVMNFNWHRDTNHHKYLVKAFIFFTDCDIQRGAHHYIAGSIQDPRFRDKTYFSDDEVHAVWPFGSKDHMISKVPAGTIIIEDTRGLHKAGIPQKDYRDLGYAIFTPPNFFRRSKPLYHIAQSTFDRLSDEQKDFIPYANILNG